MFQKLTNERGAALITAYFVITSLIALATGFALTSVNELQHAKRYRNSTQAFWLAEAGINQFLHDTTMLDDANPKTITIGSDTITLSKDDSDPSARYVTATASIGGVERQIRVKFSKLPPDVFDYTLASGGDITLSGTLAKLDVYGKTRISGTFQQSGWGASGWFEDKQEDLPVDDTTLTVPDSNDDGTPDEFGDFIQYSNNIVNQYSEDEVVHIQTDDTVTIIPNSYLAGKKVIFVEGSSPGTGDVNVIFDASWQPNQNLTIISTGTVNYIQPLQFVTNSQLNIISWEGYYEPSIFLSTHTGITYTHGTAEYFEILDYSKTTGTLVANEGVNAVEVIAHKKFLYDSALTENAVPPGFEGLIGTGQEGYSSTPSEWKDLSS